MKRPVASVISSIALLLLLCRPLTLNAQVASTPISTVAELQAINDSPEGLTGRYILVNDIDAGATAGWNGGSGFEPIGSFANPFRGLFDGNGHVINGLAINRPTTGYVGLFGAVTAATIQHVGGTGCNITGRSHVGALMGYGRNSEIMDNCHSSGAVTAGAGAPGGATGHNVFTTAGCSSMT